MFSFWEPHDDDTRNVAKIIPLQLSAKTEKTVLTSVLKLHITILIIFVNIYLNYLVYVNHFSKYNCLI